MSEKKVLLIIPAYNESEGIAEVIETVRAYQAKTPYQLDYIVINDGSTDDEEAVLVRENIHHVELIHNLGIGGAVQTGYKYAWENNYDIAVQYDGDGQHDIESLPQLLTPIFADEVDFTVGSRFIDESQSDFKSSNMRQLGIRILSKILTIATKTTIADITSGYRAGNRKVIEAFVERYPSKYPEPESYVLLQKKNIRVKEVGVKMYERTTGTSSIHVKAAVGYMVNVSLAILFATMIEKEGKK